ncbi:protein NONRESPONDING TO OXYLIPINS 2, mitochondrial isoform X2 [Salvia miltiorrhiza]|uniref:protein NONRESPONDING TO OXYLIPINS 2, mitochondrial isoform X2 n=1 Tax=Salvia miltiorrhiza TaxID=226208 RepID=UPI0025AD3B1A|nr:protein NONRESPONDING TO OXYLIPINS 2, mitochondrial isoform X2 [Salvia miltiorrhiza]
MASRCSRIFQRSSVSALKSAISKPASSSLNRSATTPSKRPSLFSSPVASPLHRFSLSRAPAELGGVASLLPLHSAVATARMTSCLSSSSRSCRALSQELGLSVPR